MGPIPVIHIPHLVRCSHAPAPNGRCGRGRSRAAPTLTRPFTRRRTGDQATGATSASTASASRDSVRPCRSASPRAAPAWLRPRPIRAPASTVSRTLIRHAPSGSTHCRAYRPLRIAASCSTSSRCAAASTRRHSSRNPATPAVAAVDNKSASASGSAVAARRSHPPAPTTAPPPGRRRPSRPTPRSSVPSPTPRPLSDRRTRRRRQPRRRPMTRLRPHPRLRNPPCRKRTPRRRHSLDRAELLHQLRRLRSERKDVRHDRSRHSSDDSSRATSRDESLMKPLARERSKLFDREAGTLRPVSPDLSEHAFDR